MNRRTFLKIAGTGSIAFATGCTADPERTLYSFVEAPDDMVTGQPAWYASTCRECPAGCGVLAKNREGRIIKLEGNPHHPVNRGALCMRGQAALQGVYNPDRLRQPMRKEDGQWRPVTYDQAAAVLKVRISEAAKLGPNRVRMISEMTGNALMSLFEKCLGQWNAGSPFIYEHFAYSALKRAHHTLFGRQMLPAYHMERADFLLCFGAEFLETWLSPVEYARKLKKMHAVHTGPDGAKPKGVFFHISPYQSLTGVNADHWLPNRPQSEAAVVLGLLRAVLGADRGAGLPEALISAVKQASAPYTLAKTAVISGIPETDLERLTAALLAARAPLILGTGSGNGGRNAYPADLAAVLLNLVLNPQLPLHDFSGRHCVEAAQNQYDVLNFFRNFENDQSDVMIIHNTNPVFTLPPESRVASILSDKKRFVICFSGFMDETAAVSDLVFPIQHPLESWDAYGGKTNLVSTLQPAMGPMTQAQGVGDFFMDAAFLTGKPPGGYKGYLVDKLLSSAAPALVDEWMTLIRTGFMARETDSSEPGGKNYLIDVAAAEKIQAVFSGLSFKTPDGLSLAAVPSIRFFDGKGANRPWLCEIPDPLTQVAWQTPVLMHPDQLQINGIGQGDIVTMRSRAGEIDAPVYAYPGLHPALAVMAMGQGHRHYGRYASKVGRNPIDLLSTETSPVSGGAVRMVHDVVIVPTGKMMKLARTDGSRDSLGRKIALRVDTVDLSHSDSHGTEGLTMNDFPLTLPIPEGYDPSRDIYPPHEHVDYRWGMVVDLDRCIGCSACAAACYAENNLGVVGAAQIINGREMAWLQVQRYHDPDHPARITFLPMMCQHCDNAPCEAVCPVYAPHHSAQGLNNQIYNRCIGTRFCAQNCPYKVRRFNWFEWKWPAPLHWQLNPNVTVRAKGVMEKCSFCIQRIKDARNKAKNENRLIRDGEVIPACEQTCPTGALTFGSYMDPGSRLRELVKDPRAYQVIGYLNTKPAVIYLKKVNTMV